MADSKKYNGSTWEHSLRKVTTATEAVENPLYSDGTAITSYTISGNTVQNGTPTPSNPVDVNGVGVRTENLFDWSAVTTGYRIAWSTGALVEDASAIMSDFIQVSRDAYRTNASFIMLGYDSSKAYVGTYNPSTTEFKKAFGNKTTYFTIPAEVTFVRLLSYSVTDTLSASTMLNTGSTAKPFEPYGYKIPISSGGVTTNIYLGSTQTTRKIKKIVFKGLASEGWYYNSSIGEYDTYRTNVTSDKLSNSNKVLCTHFPNYGFSERIEAYEKSLYIYVKRSEIDSLTQFNQFLQQQYSVGTPVTVWYVLATPTTAAVNEPLMKIGNYSDTLSNATAIPTTDGANSITVDTTVQPSEFTATWTGWHDASVKEWDGSDWE